MRWFASMLVNKRVLFRGGMVCAVFAVVVCLIPRATVAAETRVVRGHVPPVVGRLRPIGDLDGAVQLRLALGLPLHNRTALSGLLGRIYDPAGPNFRHYLTPEQFRERFGPTEREYQAVADFVRSRGLRVSGLHSGRMVLEVSGPAAAVERAFGVKLRVYRHPSEDRTFYAPDSEPRVESDIPLAHISGLDNFAPPRPAGLRLMPAPRGRGARPASGSATGGYYAGNDFRAAYAPGVALTGAGQSVALVEFSGYYPSDIRLYENQFHVPDVTLTNILLLGVSSVTNGASSTEAAEPPLDIEMVISMAPGLSSVRVYYGPNESASVDPLLSQIADDNAARQVGASWSWADYGDATTSQLFQQMAAQGQSYFTASGDSDAYTGSIPPPFDNPYITVVGGTFLGTRGPGAGWSSETAWNRGDGTGTGGGTSPTYPIPPWQQGIDMTACLGSTYMRNIPDVALVADNVWIIAQGGQGQPVGGTSVSTPLWAGFTALVNQQAAANGKPPVGFLNPALYLVGKGAGYAAAFHDITVGNNVGTNTAPRFPAVAGYDLCTGWGTPAGSNLINALAAPIDFLEVSPAAGFSAATPYGTPFSPTNTTFTLTNTSASALHWRLGNTSVWLHASASAGVLTADAPATNVTIALDTASTSNLAAGAYYANVWFTNEQTTLIQGRLFALTVSGANWPIALTNFNAGVIVPASATIAAPQATAFDLVNDYSLYQAGLDGGSEGLPQSGAFVSQADNATVFQFGPYGGANVLLTGSAYPASGTLTLVDPRSYNSLAILAASANGGTTSSLVLQFTDGTSSGPLSLDVQDWLNATTNSAIQGFGRLRLSDFVFEDDGPDSPRLCQSAVDLASLGLNQPLASITFSNLNPNSTQDCGIFAVSGAIMPPQPVLVRQPFSLTNTVPSQAAILSVVAMGAPPLAYQWFFSPSGAAGSFAPLGGQTSPELALEFPDSTNAGSYYVVVTNSYNAVTSQVAMLSVFRAPVVVQQPGPPSATLFAAQSFSLSATAIAALPLYYSWTQNGVPVPDGTNSVLAFDRLDVSDTGDYSLVVSNAFGEATSSVVSLTVIATPDYPYAQQVLVDQPLGYWRLDELSGAVVHDYIAAHNGVYLHTTLGQPGYDLIDSHTAARFGIPSSANSYAGGVAADFASSSNAAFSVEAWVKGNAQSSDCGLVSKGAGGSEQFSLDCGGSGHTFRFLVRDASGGAHPAGGTLAPDGKWHHLVGVCDEANGAVSLYVDGVQAAQAAIAVGSGVLGSANPMALGSRQSGTTIYDLQFVGSMEEVALYGYPLSSNQIQTHFSVVTNRSPVFLANPFTVASATAGQAYEGTMATNAVDPNGGILAFAKVSGPAWLSVAADGELSGTPANTDAGTNTFVVSAIDAANLSATATMNLLVLVPQVITAALTWQGTNLLLSWGGSGGASTYQVQMTTNLAAGNWQNLAGPLGATNLLFAPSNSAAFFQVVPLH